MHFLLNILLIVTEISYFISASNIRCWGEKPLKTCILRKNK